MATEVSAMPGSATVDADALPTGCGEINIKEWTGLEWNIILRKAEDHEEWRKLVVKSTVVLQRSAGLQDR